MQRRVLGMLALALFVAGLGIAVQGNRLQAQAPAKAARPRWEYRVETWTQLVMLGDPKAAFGSYSEQQFLKGLAKLGDDGWELVQVDSPQEKYYFKRSK